MAVAPLRALVAHLTAVRRLLGRREAAAAAIAAAALALLLARSWRIDYDYSIDFQTYWLAGSRLLHGKTADLYAAGGGPAEGTPAVMTAREFKNLPIVATVFVPFAVFDYPTAKRVFWWLSVGAVAGAAWVLGRWVVPRALGSTTVRALGSFAVLASIAPTHIGLRHGQTTPIVALLISVYLACAQRRMQAMAGRALALACLVKFPPLALVALDAARGRRRIAIACALALAGAVFVSLAAFGPALHREYAQGIAAQAETVIPAHNNQSLLAVATRLIAPVPPNDWAPRPVLKGARTVALTGGAILVALVAFGIGRARAGESPESVAPRLSLEVAAALPVGVVVLPIAWDHYFLMLAPGLIATAASGGARNDSRGRSLVAASLVALVLIGVPTPSGWLEAATTGSFIHAIALSHYFLGALAISALSIAALRSTPCVPSRETGRS